MYNLLLDVFELLTSIAFQIFMFEDWYRLYSTFVYWYAFGLDDVWMIF